MPMPLVFARRHATFSCRAAGFISGRLLRALHTLARQGARVARVGFLPQHADDMPAHFTIFYTTRMGATPHRYFYRRQQQIRRACFHEMPRRYAIFTTPSTVPLAAHAEERADTAITPHLADIFSFYHTAPARLSAPGRVISKCKKRQVAILLNRAADVDGYAPAPARGPMMRCYSGFSIFSRFSLMLGAAELFHA